MAKPRLEIIVIFVITLLVLVVLHVMGYIWLKTR